MKKDINISVGELNLRHFMFRKQSALVEKVRFQTSFCLRREMIWLMKLKNILYTRKKEKHVQE